MKILFPDSWLSQELTETASLAQLEAMHRETCAYSNKLRESGAMTPPHLSAAFDYMAQRDQTYCHEHLATARELSAKGYPKLAQRLAEVRREVEQLQQIYAEMFRDTKLHEARRFQIVQTTQAEINSIYAQTAANMRATYERANDLRGLVNIGVPIGMATFLSRTRSFY